MNGIRKQLDCVYHIILFPAPAIQCEADGNQNTRWKVSGRIAHVYREPIIGNLYLSIA